MVEARGDCYSEKCYNQARTCQTGHRVDSEKAFKVNYRARNKQTLAFAEAVAIYKRSPDFCVQKQMVVNLGLNW